MVSQIQQGKQWKQNPERRPRGELDERRCDRFWALVEKTETCWLWRGHVEANGYGRTSIGAPPNRTAWLAHRLAWVIENGPIPPGRWVLHRCDVRRCVRPSHLFLGTHEENMRDAAAKGRLGKGHRGSANGTAKLTELDVRCIRALRGTLSTRDLGKNFGISASQVSLIHRGVAWRHVSTPAAPGNEAH
jgi:hypothetical protein